MLWSKRPRKQRARRKQSGKADSYHRFGNNLDLENQRLQLTEVSEQLLQTRVPNKNTVAE